MRSFDVSSGQVAVRQQNAVTCSGQSVTCTEEMDLGHEVARIGKCRNGWPAMTGGVWDRWPLGVALCCAHRCILTSAIIAPAGIASNLRQLRLQFTHPSLQAFDHRRDLRRRKSLMNVLVAIGVPRFD